MSIHPVEPERLKLLEIAPKFGPGDRSGLVFNGQIRFLTAPPADEFTLNGVLNLRNEETINTSLAYARADQRLAQWIPALEEALEEIQLATRLGEVAYLARSK